SHQDTTPCIVTFIRYPNAVRNRGIHTKSAPSATSNVWDASSNALPNLVNGLPHSQIAVSILVESRLFRATQSWMLDINAGSLSVTITLFAPRHLRQYIDRNPVPAPSSTTFLSLTRQRPSGVERYVPRCNDASHVRNPVVP